MATLSAVPKDVYDDHKTTLFQSMTSTTQTAGIILSALQRNGSTVTWVATEGILKFSNGSQVEHIGFSGISVDGTTSNITLTTAGVTRDLPWNSVSWTGAGAGIKWAAGTTVELVWDSRHVQKTAYLDQANTFATGTQTFQVPIIISGSTSYLRVPSLTTSQRTSLTGANGMIVYDSDLGQFYKYEAGAWAAIATGSFSNAANTTAGKVDIATAAEVAAGTATDATSGALNVIPVSIVKPTSTGAVSGSVPCLNTSIVLDPTIGGTGVISPTTGSVYIGAGSSPMTAVAPSTSGNVLTSNGSAWVSSTGPIPTNVLTSFTVSTDTIVSSAAENDISNTSYTVGAGTLVAGRSYEVIIRGLVNKQSGETVTFRVKIGSVTICTVTITSTSTTGTWELRGWFTCISTGAGGTIMYRFNDSKTAGSAGVTTSTDMTTAAVTLDTTASNVLKATAQDDASNAANWVRCYQVIYDRYN